MAEKDDKVTEQDETTEATPEQAEAAAGAVEAAAQADLAQEEPAAAAAEDAAAPAEAPAEPVEASVSEAAPAALDSPLATGPKPKKKRLPRALRRQRSKTKREQPAQRRPITRLEKPEHERGRRQERQGTVVSDASDKTIVVKVDVIKAHPKYKKVVRRSTKFHAHDERNEAKIGDVVRIEETRPISKQKHWRLTEIVEAAK